MEKRTKCFSAFIAATMFLSLLAVVPRTAEGWTEPVELMPDPGPNKRRDSVKIAVDSQNDLHVLWCENTIVNRADGNHWLPRIKYNEREGVTGIWTGEQELDGPLPQDSAGILSIELDEQDDPHILFSGTIKNPSKWIKRLWYSHRSAGKWDPLMEDVGLPYGFYSSNSLALDDLAQPHVVQTVYPGLPQDTKAEAQYTKRITGSWTDPPTRISSDRYFWKIKIDSSNRIHFLGEYRDRTSGRDLVYRLEPEGSDVRLGLDSTYQSTGFKGWLGLDPNNDNAIVAYSHCERRNDGRWTLTVEYRRIVEGALQPAQVVRTGLKVQYGANLFDFVVDTAGNAHFLLTDAFIGDEKVYYIHIAPNGRMEPIEQLPDIPASYSPSNGNYGNMVVDADLTVHIAYSKYGRLMYMNSSNDD